MSLEVYLQHQHSDNTYYHVHDMPLSQVPTVVTTPCYISRENDNANITVYHEFTLFWHLFTRCNLYIQMGMNNNGSHQQKKRSRVYQHHQAKPKCKKQ